MIGLCLRMPPQIATVSPPSPPLRRRIVSASALKKAIDDCAAAQGAALFLGPPVQFDIGVGEIEELVDVVGRQALDPEQMAVRERSLGGASLHEPETIGECSRPARKTHGPAVAIVAGWYPMTARSRPERPQTSKTGSALLLSTSREV